MKTPNFLIVALALVLGVSGRAATQPANPPAHPPERELAIVVVDSLQNYSLFNRMAAQFERVFGERKWPLKVVVDRFAANNEPHELELRVFYQGIRRDFDELRFRAWMILRDHGVEHDFGIVEFAYVPRPFQMSDDVLDKIYAGAAEEAANRVAPFVAPPAIVPKTAARKP